MSRKLHKFQTEAEYQAYSASTEYTTPCVAVVEENNVIYYDYGNNKPQANYTDFKVSTKSLVSDGGNTYGFDDTLYINYYPSDIINPRFNGGIKRMDISKMPNTVTSLEYTFSGNTSLIEIIGEMPSGVTDMGWTFSGCKSLMNAPKIPNGVRNMCATFQECSSIVNAPEIPSSVESMYFTFNKCSSLVNAPVIPSSVTNIDYTFYNCSNLVTAPEIPSGITDMDSTFSYCSSLVNAPSVIPSSVNNMSFTFKGCSNLVISPAIPNSVKNINYTFSGCTSLKEVTFLHTTPLTYSSTLLSCSKLESIYVPDSALEDYRTATGWSQFASKFKPLSSKQSE